MRYACVLLLLAAAPFAQPAQKQKKGDTQAVTGCLDETGEHYVIRNQDMRRLATLEPVGFEKQLFARFVGHEVSIAGELDATTDPPTLRVKSYSNIKNISDTCEGK